jgi:hypothetical protein
MIQDDGMLMTASGRREMLLTELGGNGPLGPASGAPVSPRRYAGRVGLPTPTAKHSALDGTTIIQPSVFGALVKVTTVDLLADVEHLRAFTDVLASDLGYSEVAILRTIVGALEREQRRRADDMSDVLRLGRVRQVAVSELHRRLGEW